MRRSFAALVALLLLSGVPLVARAQSPIDAADARWIAADFQGALAALDAAEARTDLTREDLVRLLELRARVHFALGASAEATAALAQLAEVAPDHRLPAEAPPELVALFDAATHAVHERLSLRIEETREEEVVTHVRARVDGDPAGLVRRVELRFRAHAADPWQLAAEDGVDVGPDGLSHFARALGPGGATLAERGSESDPLHIAPRVIVSTGSFDPWPIILGVGGGVLAVAAVVIAIAIAASGGATLGAPQWVP